MILRLKYPPARAFSVPFSTSSPHFPLVALMGGKRFQPRPEKGILVPLRVLSKFSTSLLYAGNSIENTYQADPYHETIRCLALKECKTHPSKESFLNLIKQARLMDIAVVLHDDPTDVIRWHADGCDGSHITSGRRTCKQKT